MGLISSIQLYIQRHNLCQKSDKILLAVSGGLDSMCMLDIFRKMGYTISVAHTNFNLRGAESDADTDLVNNYCKSHNIELFVEYFNTHQYATNKKISIQEAARELRYAWFEQLIKVQEFKYLMTAHHQMDVVETMLINTIRGTGTKGLLALNNNSKWIKRPLLACTKEELKSYATDNNLQWREDKSNANNKYLRNAIRNIVIPELLKIDDRAVNGFIKTQKHIADEHELLDYWMHAFTKTIWTEKKGVSILKLDKFNRFPKPIYVLFLCIQPFGFNRSQATDIWNGRAETGNQFYSNTHRLVINRGEILVEKSIKTMNTSKRLNIDIAHSLNAVFQEVEFNFSLLKNPPKEKETRNTIAYLDYAKMGKLSLRKPLPGDKFKPLGMKGNKKLQDFFTDNKLSLLEKEKVILLMSDQEIAWVVGYRISEKFKITDNTQEVLRVISHC